MKALILCLAFIHSFHMYSFHLLCKFALGNDHIFQRVGWLAVLYFVFRSLNCELNSCVLLCKKKTLQSLSALDFEETNVFCVCRGVVPQFEGVGKVLGYDHSQTPLDSLVLVDPRAPVQGMLFPLELLTSVGQNSF